MDFVPAKVPRAGDVVSIALQITTFAVLAVCISKLASPHLEERRSC
jgi:hypothetical protein